MMWVPKYKRELVESFISRLWSIFHAIEENDWERIKGRPSPELYRLAEKLKDIYRGRLGLTNEIIDDLLELEEAIKERNKTKAYQQICVLLFGLLVPWVH